MSIVANFHNLCVAELFVSTDKDSWWSIRYGDFQTVGRYAARTCTPVWRTPAGNRTDETGSRATDGETTRRPGAATRGD